MSARRRLPSCLLVAGLLAGCGGERAREPAAAARAVPPGTNLVLISIDSLRPDHLGAYGYRRLTSPHLDRLAREGIVFERAWSTTTWTLPAHLSMLSSLVPPVHNVRRTNERVSEKVELLPERLAQAGYRSAAVVSGLFLDRRYGFDQGWEVYDDRTAFAGGDLHEHENVSSGRVHARALELLDRLQSEPFFLFLHYFDVHYDYRPPPPYDRLFDPDYAGPVSGTHFARDLLRRRELAARDLEHLVALYDGEIRWVDAWLGRLFAELERRGLGERTLVVVTSDHGEEFLEHRRFGHAQNLYEPTLRVPLLVRLPGGRLGGRRSEVPVSLTDLAPTLAAAAGLPPPSGWMGRDLLPLLEGRGSIAPADLYADLFGRRRALIADGAWKAILERRYVRGRDQRRARSLELFDLARDPGERDDRAAADATRAETLRRRLERAWHGFQRAAAGLDAGRVENDPEFEKELRALGYL